MCKMEKNLFEASKKSGILHNVPLSLILQARQDIVLKTKNKYVYCRTCDLASQKSIMEFVERFKSGKLLFVFAHMFRKLFC